MWRVTLNKVYVKMFVLAVRPTGFSRFHEEFDIKMLESLHSMEIKYFYVVGLLPWVPEVCLARFPVSVNVSIVTRAKNLWRRAPFL